ncbi:MAG: sulfurtransferase TusA family protein [Gammaproteobacteria bacterium]|nr:sulfurtransferase TusA family protein [Gammaproteobacteria bacterium]
MTEPDQELDLSGLNCPLPILRTKKAIAQASSGTVLRVIGTDPGSPREFRAFAEQGGFELLSVEEETRGRYVYLIRKP